MIRPSTDVNTLVRLLRSFYGISDEAANTYVRALKKGTLSEDNNTSKQSIGELESHGLVRECVHGTDVYVPLPPRETLSLQLIKLFNEIREVPQWTQLPQSGMTGMILEGQDLVDKAVFNLVKNSAKGSEICLCVRALSPFGNVEESARVIKDNNLTVRALIISDRGSGYYIDAIRRIRELAEKGVKIAKGNFEPKRVSINQSINENFRYMITGNKVVFVTGMREKGIFVDDRDVAGWFTKNFDADFYKATEISEHAAEVCSRECQRFLDTKRQIMEELARKFATHDSRVTADKIEGWLLQFGGPGEMDLALRLLEHVTYIDDGKIKEMFQHFYHNQLTQAQRDKAAITILSKLDESSAIIVEKCSHTLAEAERRRVFNSLSDVIKSRKAEDTTVILLDDYVGSGTQACQILEELLGKRDKREYVNQPLAEGEIRWLKKTKIIYFTLIGVESGRESVEKTAEKHGISIRVISSVKQSAQASCFDPSGDIYTNASEREKAARLASEIGYQLFADKKDWSDEKKRERALGYGNLQRLIVFQYSTPTSTLPIFWKDGLYNGKEWMPLFPRNPNVQHRE